MRDIYVLCRHIKSTGDFKYRFFNRSISACRNTTNFEGLLGRINYCSKLSWSYKQTIPCFLVTPFEFFALNYQDDDVVNHQTDKFGLNYCESIYITFRQFRQNVRFFAKHWDSLSAWTLEFQLGLRLVNEIRVEYMYTKISKFCLLDLK